MKTKIITIALLSCLIICLITVSVACNREEFTGNRVKDADCYISEIEKMNGEDNHSLNLKAGDVLSVRFITEKGAIKLDIKSPDGTLLYSGDGKGVTCFALNITQSGVYTLEVKARHAKGEISVKLKDE